MIVKFESLQDAVIYAVDHHIPWWKVKPFGGDSYACEGFYIDVPSEDIEMSDDEQITAGKIRQSIDEAKKNES